MEGSFRGRVSSRLAVGCVGEACRAEGGNAGGDNDGNFE